MSDVFLSAPFDGRFDGVLTLIQELAGRRQLRAVRVDEASMIAQPVAEDIRRLLRGSRLVVADLTGNNPNVLNEVGLAQALGKPLVLISQDPPTAAAFNVRHLRILRYDPSDLRTLEQQMVSAIAETTTPTEVLRAMLVPASLGRPTSESWFVVAASPLSYRRARWSRGGYKKLRRTSSDYVGLRGILQGFGLLFGFDALPDNLDPDDCDDSVLAERANLYCIASPKANRWTARLLAEIGNRWAPRLEFRADPLSGDLRNVNTSIVADGITLSPPGWLLNEEGDRYARDFGIVVRAPNPHHSDLMVAVMAGRSSLGTEAACTLFTDLRSLEVVQQRLRAVKIDIEDHRQAFWILVSMSRRIGDSKEEAIKESLTIERVEAMVRR